MNPITLTLAQARELQRQPEAEYPGKWAFLLDTRLPREPNATYDHERVAAGVQMLRLGCEQEQIAEQLLWRDSEQALKAVQRAKVRQDKKEAEFQAEVARRYGGGAVNK